MDIIQTQHVREILLVKPTSDAPWAGHQRKITITTGAPFPIDDRYGDPEAINPAEIDGVLPEAFTDLIAERDAAVSAKGIADAALATAIGQNDQLTADLQAITADRDQLSADLATAQAELVTHASTIAAQAGTIAQLQAELAALQEPVVEE